MQATLTDLGVYQFVLEVENEVGLRSLPDTVTVQVLEGSFFASSGHGACGAGCCHVGRSGYTAGA